MRRASPTLVSGSVLGGATLVLVVEDVVLVVEEFVGVVVVVVDAGASSQLVMPMAERIVMLAPMNTPLFWWKTSSRVRVDPP